MAPPKKIDVTRDHIAKAALEHSDFLATLYITAMLSDQGLVTAMLASAIPVLGSVLRAGRSARDIEALENNLKDASTWNTEIGRQAREILALREELTRLSGRRVEVQVAAERLGGSAEQRDVVEREVRSVVKALAESPWPGRAKGYGRYLFEFVVEQPDAKEALHSLRAIYEGLQPRHAPLLGILHAAADTAKEVAAARGGEFVAYQGIQGHIDVAGERIGVGVAQGLDGATGVVVLADLARALKTAPKFVRLWMNELEKLGVVQHLRTMDMAASGPQEWSIDPIVEDLYPYVLAADARQN